MIDAGFEEEVRKLHQRNDLHVDLPSIRCVGYRQMWSYLDGEIGHDEMIYRGFVQLANWQNVKLPG